MASLLALVGPLSLLA